MVYGLHKVCYSCMTASNVKSSDPDTFLFNEQFRIIWIYNNNWHQRIYEKLISNISDIPVTLEMVTNSYESVVRKESYEKPEAAIRKD